MTDPHLPFVFGHARSGTSLLTAILDRHSKIAMLPETHLLSALREGPLPFGHEQLLLLAWDQLRTRMGDLRLPPNEILERFRGHSCSPEGLLHTLLQLWAERAGKPVAGEKTPSHLKFAGHLLSCIPNSRAIILVRDGRAVIASMRRTLLHAAAPTGRLVDSWVRAAQLCDRWLELFPERAYLIRFEDLVTETEQSLRRLLAWLGTEFEPGMMDPAPTTTFRRWEDYAKQDVVRHIMPGKATEWKEGASLLEPELLNELAPWLKRFGYPTSTPAASLTLRAGTEGLPLAPPGAIGLSRPPLLLIGAHRAGTASLNAWLGMHPEIFPAPLRPRPFLALYWPLTREGLLQHLVKEPREPLHSGQVLCHAASYYLAHPDLPRRVQESLPDARIFVILRDPVQRAFSHWLHAWRIGVETLGFDRAIEAEHSRISGAEHALTVDEGAVSFSHVHYSYQLQGRYATHLRRWLQTFPKERVVVLILEDLIADPENAWRLLCNHAGVSHIPASPFPHRMALPRPLSARAVQESRGGELVRGRLREEMMGLAELLQRQLPWVGERAT